MVLSTSQHNDVHWMQQALLQAQKALTAGEVPVGAIVVYQGACIATGHNTPITQNDPTAHAEINALRLAAQRLGNYRLQGCTLYVTLEPCAMCAMAMLHARVDRVVYGAVDSKTGAAGSALNLFTSPELNHQTQITGGVLTQACSDLLKQFFAQKRINHKAEKTLLRDDALRTPEDRFSSAKLGQGVYTNDLPALNGLQMHYHYFEPENCAQCADLPTVFCIHDAQGFSEQYAEFVPQLLDSGYKVLIPDLIGFGRSDKPKKQQWHTVQAHADYLYELLVHHLNPKSRLLLLAPQSFAELAEVLVTKLSADVKHRFMDICLIDALPPLSAEVVGLPFPDQGYKCAMKVLGAWALVGCSLPAKRVDTLTPDVWTGRA